MSWERDRQVGKAGRDIHIDRRSGGGENRLHSGGGGRP